MIVEPVRGGERGPAGNTDMMAHMARGHWICEEVWNRGGEDQLRRRTVVALGDWRRCRGVFGVGSGGILIRALTCPSPLDTRACIAQPGCSWPFHCLPVVVIFGGGWSALCRSANKQTLFVRSATGRRSLLFAHQTHLNRNNST